MKTIQQIYNEYEIAPFLQLHMLRVAGVAGVIADNFEEKLDKENILSACLLHDIGNTVKFNIEFTGKQDWAKGVDMEKLREYQARLISRYGQDEHNATYGICAEIGVSERVMFLVKTIGFSHSCGNLQSQDFAAKICGYADGRVTPEGIVSLAERLAEGHRRYRANKNIIHPVAADGEFAKLFNCAMALEKQIFAKCKIKPEDIAEEKARPLIKSLLMFEIV